MAFVATMTYELDFSATAEARKLLRAELVGRRWQDRWEGRLMPANCVWIRRTAQGDETVDELMKHCERELFAAAAAVEAMGRPTRVKRAWVQVSGAGTWGLLAVPEASE